MTNEAYLTRFEAYLLTEKRVALHTLQAYKKDCVQFVHFLNKKNISLKKVTRSQIQSFLRFLYKERIKARTIARKLSSLKAFFSYLHERDGLENKIKDIRAPKIEQALPQYLSENEVMQLLGVTEQDVSPLGVRNKIMLYLLYASGARVSELITLSISDILFDDSLLKIEGKGSKQRMVPLSSELLTLLHTYIMNTLPQLIQKKEKQSTKHYLFPICYGGKIKAMTRQAFWGIIKKLCYLSGIKRSISPHQLRHSLATHMLMQGADLRSLQILLGHENLSTVQVYTHIETSHLRTIYNKKHPRSQEE